MSSVPCGIGNRELDMLPQPSTHRAYVAALNLSSVEVNCRDGEFFRRRFAHMPCCRWCEAAIRLISTAHLVDELDEEGILAFAERILPCASDLWVQASLDYKQRLQQLFLPEGIAYDENRFNRTTVTAPLSNYLATYESADEKVVTLTFASWNLIGRFLARVDALRRAA